MINVKILNEDYQYYFLQNPDKGIEHKRDGDAGVDVRSMEDYNLAPGEVKQFKLGFALEIPDGYFGRIEGRSGNAIKFGIDTIGNIIDCNYRGEISAILVNNGDKVFEIKQFDRIAQLIICPYVKFEANYVLDKLTETERGDKGFGSSGKE